MFPCLFDEAAAETGERVLGHHSNVSELNEYL